MSSSPSTPDDPGLFDDLPLHPEESPGKVTPPPVRPKPEPHRAKPAEKKAVLDTERSEELRLLFEDEPEEEVAPPAPKRRPQAAEKEATEEPADMTRSRLVAGLIDFGVVLVVAISALVSVAWMGVDLTPLPWAPMALFLVAFSFLYCVFPLAFWGRTPGMASLGLRARGPEGQSLSFGQTAWRWLAGVATVLTFGLPLVLTLKGTYLSDVVSKSRVEFSGR